MKKFNYSKCLLGLFFVGIILSCTEETVTPKLEVSFTVTFNYNYTGAPKATTQTANSGSKINTPKTPTRLGYTFKSWNTSATGTGTDFNFETTTITEDITLYTQWEIVTYTVTFNYNYKDAPSVAPQTVNSGSKINTPTTTPTRSGYTIKAWNTKADGTGTDFDFETTTITENITLYAKWEIVTYTVTFNYNYKDAPSVAPQTVNSGSKINTPTTTPTRSGYTIKAWNTKADGTGTDFDFETTPITENITLYAKWGIAINVTFNYNYKDAPSVAPQTVNSESKINTPTTTHTRSGYAIKAWNTKADGSGVDFNFETTTITKNITLYAQWLYYPLNKRELQTLLFTQHVDPTKIDTSRITDMTDLFNGKTTFNGDISGWDTSKVEYMYSMFENASAFNGDVSKWNTSKVTSMSHMFKNASAFNGDISGWNTGKVTDMSSMFSWASAFNGNISKWNTSEVTGMTSMFYNASAFNQDLSTWEVSKVTRMSYVFDSSLMANTPCQWPVAFRPTGTVCLIKYPVTFNYNYTDAPAVVIKKVTTGQKTKAPTAPNRSGYAIKAWNTKADGTGTDFNFEATTITENITLYAQWGVAVTVTFNYNYNGAPAALVQKVLTGQTTKATTTLPDRANFSIGGWNTKVDGTGIDFNFEATTITENITLYAKWIQPFTVSFNYNYTGGPAATPQTANSGSKINKPITPTRSGYTFKAWNSKADGSGVDFNFATTITENITLYAQWLYYPLNKSALQALLFTQNVDPTKIDTGRITDMSELFKDKTTFNGDISGWDTSKVIRMYGMFQNASAFNGNISKWNTSKVARMQVMFYGASSFNGDISRWNTSEVTRMDSMFKNASAFNGDISKWNTSKVDRMSGMFQNASAFNGNISGWNTLKVTDMSGMFYNASAFNQNIGNWNTSEVTSMSTMFYGASAFNQNISKWNTSEVTGMSNMFFGAPAFNQDLSRWDVSKVTSRLYMFNSSPMANKPCQWPVAFRPSGTSCP